MSESLLRLVYVSAATAAADKHVLQSILESSTVRNKLAGITGVLCSGGGHYMQVLEGPERSVLELYARIGADPRHQDSTLLSISLVSLRMFGAWSLGHIEGRSGWTEAHNVLMAERQDESSSHRIGVMLQRFVAALRADRPTSLGAAAVQKKHESPSEPTGQNDGPRPTHHEEQR